MPRFHVPLWFLVLAMVAAWAAGYVSRHTEPQPTAPAVVRYVPQPIELPPGHVVYDETNGTRDANKLISVGFRIYGPDGLEIRNFDD